MVWENVIEWSDAERVSSLARRIWKEHYSPLISAEQLEYMISSHQSSSAIQDRIREGYQYFLVSENGKDLGYFAYVFRNDGIYLDKAYLLPEARGRRIFSSFLKRLEGLGKRRIYLSVNSQNRSSIQIYQTAGFRICGQVKNDFGAGAVFTDYVMERFSDL